jgi:hypothetical protein
LIIFCLLLFHKNITPQKISVSCGMLSSAILVVFWMQLILKIVITKVIKHIKNYLGQRWSSIAKRPSQCISYDDFFGTNDWPSSTFFMGHRASFAKHTNTICKACIKILWHSAKCGKKTENKTVWQILTFKKWLTQMFRQLFENPWPPLTKIIFDNPVIDSINIS